MVQFVIVPGDPKRPLVTCSVTTVACHTPLSCDVAYFIPLLLRDAPAPFEEDPGCHTRGGSPRNTWKSVLPYPTFNECLSPDVPLFLSRRKDSKPGPREENTRAGAILQACSDRFPKREKACLFYGDVAVFWRVDVDEQSHHMRLKDFTIEDAMRLIGSLAEGVQGSSTNTASIQDGPSVLVPTPVVQERGGLDTGVFNAPSVKSLVSHSLSGVTSGNQAAEQQTKGGVVDRDVLVVTSKATDSSGGGVSEVPLFHSTVGKRPNAECVQQDIVTGGEKVGAALSPGTTVSCGDNVSGLNNHPTGFWGVRARLPENASDFQQARTGSLKEDSSSACISSYMPTEVTKVNGSSPYGLRTGIGAQPSLNLDSNIPSAALEVLKHFVHLIALQLPLVSTALDSLSQQGEVGQRKQGSKACDARLATAEQRIYELEALLLQSQVAERRLSADVLRLTDEIGHLSRLNHELVKETDHCRREAVAARVEAQAYVEEGTQLAREAAALRNEMCKREMSQRFTSQENLQSRMEMHAPSSGVATGNNNSTTAVSTRIHCQRLSSGRGSPTRNPLDSSTATVLGGNVSGLGLFFPKGERRSFLSASFSSEGSMDKDGINGSVLQANGGAEPRSSSYNKGTSKQKWSVTQAYKHPAQKGVNDKFADLDEGDLVTVEREDSSGWWWVSNDKTSGWFPYSFLAPTNA